MTSETRKIRNGNRNNRGAQFLETGNFSDCEFIVGAPGGFQKVTVVLFTIYIIIKKYEYIFLNMEIWKIIVVFYNPHIEVTRKYFMI